MAEGDDPVAAAVRGLLEASREFTQAYEAWLAAPRDREPGCRSDLDRAEHRLSHARDEVVFAQLKRH